MGAGGRSLIEQGGAWGWGGWPLAGCGLGVRQVAGVRARGAPFPWRSRPGSMGLLGLRGVRTWTEGWGSDGQHQPLGGLGVGVSGGPGQGSGILIIVTLNPTFLQACVTQHWASTSLPHERAGIVTPFNRLRN